MAGKGKGKGFTQKQIEDAKGQLVLDGDSETQATNALVNFGVEPSHDNVILSHALAHLKGRDGRVTKKLFSNHQVKITQKLAVTVTYYLVQRKDLPVIPPEASSLVVDPASVPDFPRGHRKEDIWLLMSKFSKRL